MNNAKKAHYLSEKSSNQPVGKHLHITLSDKLKEQKWYHEGDWILVGGAICTVDMFWDWEMSAAHLGEDGLIHRHKEVIGTAKDITEV